MTFVIYANCPGLSESLPEKDLHVISRPPISQLLKKGVKSFSGESLEFWHTFWIGEALILTFFKGQDGKISDFPDFIIF